MEKSTHEEIDKTLYSEKALNLLNVSELRDIGRKFGVPSPTTMKKKDLVDYILKIVYGEVNVPVRNNYGRPSKAQFDMSRYLEKIKNNQEISSELMKVKLDMDYGSLMVSDKSQKYQNSNSIESRILCRKQDKFYLKRHQFVDSDSDIEISSEIVHKFNLEELDVIEIIKIDNEFKIVTINGIKVPDGFKDLVLDGKIIRGGNKQDFYFSTKEEIHSKIFELVEKCKDLSVKTIVYASENFENVACNFVYSEQDESSKNYKKFINMISVCEKYMRESEDIILIIGNMEDVENMVASFESQVSERIKNNLEEIISKFLGFKNSIVTFRLMHEATY